jgi:amidase
MARGGGARQLDGRMMRDDLLHPGLNGAFVADGFGLLPSPTPQTGARLAGKRLAVKDVFEVEGLTAGGGNPAWLAEQTPTNRTALPVRALLEQGAQWIGKTVTDELTYSLAGINAHYGTPVNPADAARIPGGSSSGSAVAVAAGHADIGLGTDCGGSVRLPASYCGIWGIRPTHGRIPSDGCLTLAHSFDTVGWFTRDPQLLCDIFEVLAHSKVPDRVNEAVLRVPGQLLPLLDDAARTRFNETIATLGGVESAPPVDADLDQWAQAFRVLQGAEIAQRYRAWAQAHIESFGADIRRRFELVMTLTESDVLHAQQVRVQAIRAMAHAFNASSVYWIMPTQPWIAPRTDASLDEVDAVRARSQQMLCIAGLAGLPQVTMPWTTFESAPLGISIIGARGDDEGVLAVARAMHARLAVPV